MITDLRKPNKKLPYNFAEIDADVLGKAYENFIGHVITGEKRLSEKESISKRKEEGAYYTPQYIVNYIVDNTLRAYIKEKSISGFDDLLKIRVLDPACGSGTFLIRAFEVLEEEARRILGREPNYEEKVKLMTSCVFGVDKDERAVDIAKLRLSLSLAARQKLPELGRNIQCGDSLIDDVSVAGEKAFKWEERFKDVFAQSGFDVVVGNPPYVNLVALSENQRKYFQSNYRTCKNKSDLYSFFIEKSLRLVNNIKFKFGFILPNSWLATESFELLRKQLLHEKHIEQLVDVGFKVFQNVIVNNVILIGSQNNTKIKVFNRDFTKRFEIHSEIWEQDNYHIDLNWDMFKQNLYDKLKINTVALETIVKFQRGIKTSNDQKFILKELKDKECKKIFRGRNIKAYQLNWEGEYVWYMPDLMKQKVGSLPHSKDFFEVPEKLVTQRVNSSMQLLVAYDNQQNYFLDTTNVSSYNDWNKKYSLKYVCGLLNSKLINFWYCNRFKMPTIGLYELHSIPIKLINFDNKKEKDKYHSIIELVDKMLSLNKRLNELGDKHTVERERIEEEIKKTDAEIDGLVYQLYGITEDEKMIIEESLK